MSQMKQAKRRYLPHVIIYAGIVLVLISFTVFAENGFAHQAKSGWIYPLDCCDDRDCRQLEAQEVTIGPDYYIWKGKHISFKSPKIRNSPDGFFHGCENAHWGDTSGNLEITCFFVPTNG
jgi:hypothetical protein